MGVNCRWKASGEYGLAIAFEDRVKDVEPWLEDDNENVRTFAEAFIVSMNASAKRERERADEYIALRKHEFGVTEEE